MPEEEVGIAFIVLGVVLMALGIFFFPICGIGLILLVVGIIFIATSQSRSHAYAQPGYGYPPAYAYPPQPSAPGMSTPPPQYNQPLCPVCGSPLSWVPQYGRWYCSRCQAYR